MLALIAKTFMALLPICNPLGNAAIFLSITEGDSLEFRHQQARKGAIYMFALLILFATTGTVLMHFFGITLDGIRIAGGIIVARVGLHLLSPRRRDDQSDREHAEAKTKVDISFSPLALPLLAGPGAIAVVMSLGTELDHFTWQTATGLTIGVACVCATTWVTLRQSHIIMKFLGVNGANALTRIMGFLLLAIAVQFIVDGSSSIIEELWLQLHANTG